MEQIEILNTNFIVIMQKNFFYIFIILLSIYIVNGCGHKGGNPVWNYLKNSELKYDNKTSRDNIKQACKDVVMLSPDDLKKIRYKDVEGSNEECDLQALFTKHFIPKKAGLSWGDDFYHDVKQDSIKSFLTNIYYTY